MARKYAFGSDMGNLGTGLFDMSSSLLQGLTMKGVIDLFGTINGVKEQEQRLVKSNTQPVMALGGKVPSTQIEVEDNEVVELPNKKVAKVKGKTHEEGGVNLEVPPTTKIYSDRLEVGGKSLADRKMKRETKVAKLEKYLSENPTDKITKSTLERTVEANQKEETRDLQLQELANSMNQAVEQFMYGTTKKGVPKYPNGGIVPGEGIDSFGYDNTLGLTPNWYPNFGDLTPRISEPIKPGYIKVKDPKTKKTTYKTIEQGELTNPINYTSDSPILPGADFKEYNERKQLPIVEGIPTMYPSSVGGQPIMLNQGDKITGIEDGFAIMDTGDFDYSNSPVYDATTVQNITDNLQSATGGTEGDTPFKRKNPFAFLQDNTDETQADKTGMGLTLGDAIGFAGTAQAKFLPMINTMINRAGDKPNVNMYRDFGTDAIAAIEQAKQLATMNRNAQLQDIQLGEAAATRRNRNSATSVNTQRALDLATDSNVSEAQQNAYSSYAQQMMQMLGQQSGLENVQDQYIMAGEQARDLADRQDRDNYFTQLGQNLANYANFTQKTGADLNQMQYREDFLAMLPEMSQYGIGIEYQNGRPVLKQMKTTTTKPEDVKSKVKEVATEITAGEDNNFSDMFGTFLDETGEFLANFQTSRKKK